MTHSIGGFRHVLLLQDTYELIPRTCCYPSCCNSLWYCGLKILVLCSGNFSASATSLHLGWHGQPGNGSAGLSNHTTTGPETSAHCLKIVLGLAKGMGEAGRCAAHKSTSKPSPCGHAHRQMCCSQSTSKQSPCGHKHRTKLLKEKQETETGQEHSNT